MVRVGWPGHQPGTRAASSTPGSRSPARRMTTGRWWRGSAGSTWASYQMPSWVAVSGAVESRAGRWPSARGRPGHPGQAGRQAARRPCVGHGSGSARSSSSTSPACAATVGRSKRSSIDTSRSSRSRTRGQQPGRGHRVAAQVEEVLVRTRGVGQAQHLGPALGDERSTLGARLAGGRRRTRRRPSSAVEPGRIVEAEPAGQPDAHELAGRSLGQLVDHHHPARHLVGGEPVEPRTGAGRARSGVAPVAGTTAAATSSPSRGSGTAKVTASATAGWSSSTSSTSRGDTFSPPRLIMLLRSPGERQEPLGVEAAQVTGAEPAVDERVAVDLPSAVTYPRSPRPPDHDLADLARLGPRAAVARRPSRRIGDLGAGGPPDGAGAAIRDRPGCEAIWWAASVMP